MPAAALEGVGRGRRGHSYRWLLLRGFTKSKPTSSLFNVTDDSFIGFEECFELSNASFKAISCLHLDNVVIEASRMIQTNETLRVVSRESSCYRRMYKFNDVDWRLSSAMKCMFMSRSYGNFGV